MRIFPCGTPKSRVAPHCPRSAIIRASYVIACCQITLADVRRLYFRHFRWRGSRNCLLKQRCAAAETPGFRLAPERRGN